MTLAKVIETAIRPAYDMLPIRMASASATAMLLAIGLQESRLEHRRQLVALSGGRTGFGPAFGLWQFEPGGGVRGVRTHGRTHVLARNALIELNHDPNASDRIVCEILSRDDVLAACFARLLLWTLPQPLPGPDDVEESWHQYLSAWRPGKPHRKTWNAFYVRAWSGSRVAFP